MGELHVKGTFSTAALVTAWSRNRVRNREPGAPPQSPFAEITRRYSTVPSAVRPCRLFVISRSSVRVRAPAPCFPCYCYRFATVILYPSRKSVSIERIHRSQRTLPRRAWALQLWQRPAAFPSGVGGNGSCVHQTRTLSPAPAPLRPECPEARRRQTRSRGTYECEGDESCDHDR